MIKKIVWNYLERTLSRLEKTMEKTGKVSRESPNFRVVTYQLEFRPFETVERILNFFENRLKDVAKFSPSVMAFPRFFGNTFLGLVPFSSNKLKSEKGVSIVRAYSTLIRSSFVRFLSRLSVSSGGVVVGGTFKEGDKEEAIISYPNGKVLMFNSESDSNRVFHVSGIKCAFLFPHETLDHRMVRSLSEDGVRVFFTTETVESGHSDWEIKKGIWARSQSIGIYGVNSSINGSFLGTEYRGIAFISAPAVLTKNLDGFVAKLNSPTGMGMVVADLDLESLEAFIDSLPKTYRKYRSFV